MKVVIGGQYYPTLDATSISITRSATDPVPTCALNLIDNTSSLAIQTPAEILVLDDQKYANTTANLALNPSLNPYTSLWTTFSGAGLTLSQKTGGGLIWTFNNCTLVPGSLASIMLLNGSVVPGVTYVFSAYVQGGSSPTNIGAGIGFEWQDASGGAVGGTPTFSGPVPITTSLTRYTCSGVAPAGAVTATLFLDMQRSSSTNSGTITWTEIQFEPEWFPTLSYPTPWCGPSQTNCVQLPLGYWIRQYRKFAGFVNHPVAENYHGNVRTLVVNAVGYAWLLSLQFGTDSFSSQTDAAIITSLLNKYLVESGTQNFLTFDLVSTANVITGQTLTSVQLNWDDLRTIFDNLAGTSTYYWNIDDYWNMNYAPPGYFSQGIGLICDDSGNPDNVTTFPGYNFSAEQDFTQPGAAVLCIGSGSNVSLVYDPSRVAQLSQISGYYLPGGSSWMRKINDSTLGSTTDTTNRAMAELLLYRYPRNIYHVTTNVELIPGQSIQVTSATEGLSAASLLVQQTTATWLGTNELLQDEWEYQSDLGATNRKATNIISRIFRQTQQNSSAPAISVTTLAVGEVMGLTESIGTAALATNYFATVQGDGPVALYPCNELAGTILDDTSGKAQQGTISGAGVTYGASSLLTNPADTADTALTLNGSTGVLTLPAAVNGNGLSAWSVEVWFSLSSTVLGSVTAIAVCGNGTNTVGWQLYWTSNTALNWTVGTGASSATASFAVAAATNTVVYLLGTYDGANVRLYVNGSLKATTALTGAISASTNAPTVGAYNNSAHFFPGTVQYVGLYSSTLSGAQASAHNTAGT